ncbi:MAG: hypothetical protein KKH28_02160 [Elusimicrobia bacterium]|nr:hypothetical protein [Elusimicrobiota bacterium]
MLNPFYYGQVAIGADFTDRTTELKELVGELDSGARVFLISPRRYGKTSLAFNALAALKERGIITAYMDMYDVSTVEQFAAHYARAIARAAETKTESIVGFIREVIPSLRPNITISAEGEISVGIEAAPKKPELSLLIKELLEIPQKTAERKKKKFAVFFDEFQEIRNVGGEALEKAMRSVFQRQKDVGYLFAGSKQHIMSDMVLNKNKPFYKMGKVLFLGKIPSGELSSFISGKFGASGKTMDAGTEDEIIKVSRAIPYYTLHLCHEIWNGCADKKSVPRSAVAEAVDRLVQGLSPMFISMWDSLALSQRKLLQAMAASGATDLFSMGFINSYRLGSASSVQKSEALLTAKGLLEKEDGVMMFSDIWFREWIKKKYLGR